MQTTIEMSMYPFNEDYKTLILDFIDELNRRDGLEVYTTATSTMIHGEHGRVMDALKEMTAWSHEHHGRGVFVTKIIPGFPEAEK
jgi:uncharacterized protein YqgV (UPF0045/DUF77 family)